MPAVSAHACNRINVSMQRDVRSAVPCPSLTMILAISKYRYSTGTGMDLLVDKIEMCGQFVALIGPSAIGGGHPVPVVTFYLFGS